MNPFFISIGLLACCILIYCLCEWFLMTGVFRRVVGTMMQGLMVCCGWISSSYAVVFYIIAA